MVTSTTDCSTDYSVASSTSVITDIIYDSETESISSDVTSTIDTPLAFSADNTGQDNVDTQSIGTHETRDIVCSEDLESIESSCSFSSDSPSYSWDIT